MTGHISLISGPVVKVEGLKEVEMLEMLLIGNMELPGEVIKMNSEEVTVQVYEDTGGLRAGEPVKRLYHPLSVELGPGLIGSVFDGIQRPLERLAEKSGAFLDRGQMLPALGRDKKWKFTPMVSAGTEVAGGCRLAWCDETPSIKHYVLLHPDISGTVESVEPEGEYHVDATLLTIRDDKDKVHEITGYHRWPVKTGRPIFKRLAPSDLLITGERIIDTFFPLAKGGTAAIPGGFGTGKTMTQHSLAKWCDADIIVYIGCGERGNEMTQVLEDFPGLTDPRTGRSLMERTVLIGNTSNMPVAAREASVYTGITIAEYYRDQGYDVAVMADSTSRWAEAMREISSRLEEMPAEGGFPAYLPARLAGFYERAGVAENTYKDRGSVTIIGAVSPPGGDFSEPVTQQTKRFTRCFWGLDKDLAQQRHYPAISWLTSYSDYVATLKNKWDTEFGPLWSKRRAQALSLLQEEAKLAKIVKLVGEDALPVKSRLILFATKLLRLAFLQQNAFDKVDCFSMPDKQAKMLEILMTFYDRALNVFESGVDLKKIVSMNCVSRLWQMKTLVADLDTDPFAALQEAIDKEFAALEKGAMSK
jgi:V/A-type H+-transporting ATPase subunit A